MAHFLSGLLKNPEAGWAVTHARTGALVVSALETAFDSATRKRGLLGRSGLAAGAGLVIAPSNAVHSFFMQFAIDVVFLDRAGRVLKVRQHLGPRRVTACWRGFAVLELPAGTAAATGVEPGDTLTITAADKSASQRTSIFSSPDASQTLATPARVTSRASRCASAINASS